MTQPLDGIDLRQDGRVAVLTLDDGKGNALSRASLERFERALREAAETSHALVLRGREKVFCGGLDLPALVALDRAGLEDFLVVFNRVHDLLLGYPIPIVTVARGSAVAGGAILFAAGDHRLTTPAGKIGINEVALGLNIPTSALEVVRSAVGERAIAEVALSGALYEGEDRVRLGFATEIVAPERIDERALELAATYAKHDRAALALLRRQIRAEAIARAERNGVADSRAFADRWFAPETQERLRAVVARLGAR